MRSFGCADIRQQQHVESNAAQSNHLPSLPCEDTELYTHYCCYYTINRSGREQTPTLMHVRLNDERQPLRGTARRCLQTGGVWLITVTKTVESETADSGGKRKRDSHAHDGQQKEKSRVLQTIGHVAPTPAQQKKERGTEELQLSLLPTRQMHEALEDASIGDVTVDATTSSTASDCGKAPPAPIPVPVNPGIITIQRQYTACHDAPAVGVLKQWLAGGSRSKSSAAANTTAAAADDAATAGTGDSAESDSDTTATDEPQQDEFDIEDEAQLAAAETEPRTELDNELNAEPDAMQYDDDNDAVVLSEADSRMIDAFVAKLDKVAEGVAVDALLDAAEAEQARGVEAMNNCSIFKKDPTAATAATATATAGSSETASTAVAVTLPATDTLKDGTVLFRGALATAEDAPCSGSLHSAAAVSTGSDTMEVCVDANANNKSTAAETVTAGSTTKTTTALSTYVEYTTAATATASSCDDNAAVTAHTVTDNRATADESKAVDSTLGGGKPGADTENNITNANSGSVMYSTTTALSNYANTVPVVATASTTVTGGSFDTRTTETPVSEKLTTVEGATQSRDAIDSTAKNTILGTTTALSTYVCVLASTTAATAAAVKDTTNMPTTTTTASSMVTDTTVHEHNISSTTDEHSNDGSDTETTTATATTAGSATADGAGAACTVLSEAAYKEALEAANSIATFTCDTPVMMHYTMYPEPARSKQVTVTATAAANNTIGRSDGTQIKGNIDSNIATMANTAGTVAATASSDATASGSSFNKAVELVAAKANASSTPTTATTASTATDAAATAVNDTVEGTKADDTLSDSDADDMSLDDNESDTPAEPEPLTAAELRQQQLAISESTNSSGTVSVATAAGTTVPTARLLRRSTRDVADAAATATAASFTVAASATADAAVHDDDSMSECRSVADDTVHSSSGTLHTHKQKRKRDSDPAQVQEEDRSAKGLWEKGAKKRVKHVQRYEVDADVDVTAVLQKCQLNPSQLKVVKRFMDDAYSTDPALHLVQGPPGSGKTTTIVSLLCALAVKKDTSAVHTAQPIALVCAPSNKAIQVNVLMVGVLDKLPEGDSGTDVRSVYLETFASEWTSRLSTLSTDLMALAT
eukprot:6205-Heterococcus_DN1.PRE.2